MKRFIQILFAAAFSVSVAGVAATAFAATPMFSSNLTGSGDQARLTISNADPYAQITLSRRQSTQLWTTITNFGQTDGSGYFSTVASLGSDGSSNPVEQYVVVNGQQSQTVQTYPYGSSGGCTYNCGNPYTLSLSQTSVSLNVGQSTTVTAYGSVYSGLYISQSPSSSVAYASVSGSSVVITGQGYGSTSLTVCSNGGGQCATINVMVNGGSSYYGTLSLSQSSITVASGQSTTVSVYSSSGYTPYVSSNSSPSVASYSMSGSSIIVNAISSGSTTMQICVPGSGQCVSLYVTVTGSSGSIYLGQTSLSLNTNQTQYVSASGYSSFYISSNSSPSVASAVVSGSGISITGLSSGSTTITVCANYGSGCASVYVTVNGGSSYGSVYFSQQNVNLNSGQYQQVTVYSNNYGGNYYLSSNSNPSSVSANVVGNQINLTGNSSGSATITVCQSAGSGCASVYVTVNGSGTAFSLSQTSVTINSGQSASVVAYGVSGSLYISSNSNPSAASATVSGSQINIYASGSGNATVSVCQNGSYAYGSSCQNIYVYVNGYGYGSGSLSILTGSLPQPVAGQYYSSQLQASGGSAPYTYSLTGGYLPSGLTLSASGYISGTPVSGSSGSATVRVTDQYGRTASASFSMTVSGGGAVLGASTYANGTLLLMGNTIYIVYNNTKTGFSSGWVFEKLGYRYSQVIPANGTYIPDSGYTITNPYAAHPWGAWIKSGSAIYFVHQSGLIPVPDWNTFLNNGGSQYEIVNANQYDFALPMLAPMAYSDSRMRQ